MILLQNGFVALLLIKYFGVRSSIRKRISLIATNKTCKRYFFTGWTISQLTKMHLMKDYAKNSLP